MIVPPGSTIGIVGGGQLGRMLALAAAPLGYRCHIFDPHERPCAAEVAAHFTRAGYDDGDALEAFAAGVDVVTFEFENLPAGPLARLGGKLRPSIRSLTVAQDRAEEKRFLEANRARVAPWRTVDSHAEVNSAVAELGLPLVLKTRRYGYDGKGQSWIRSAADAAGAWAAIGRQPAVAEAGIAFAAEFSIIAARTAGGEIAGFEPVENVHADGILRRSSVPSARAILDNEENAVRQVAAIANALDHVGVITVEFFATPSGPIVNEIAPRVHNSGHWTIEGAAASQFEQHVRAICGLPLGSPSRIVPRAAMDNLIGDEIERWRELVAEPGARLHVYDKGEPRPGRKMGHVTRLG